MQKRFLASLVLVLITSAITVLAQNSNSSVTVRPRQTTTPTSTNRSSSEATRSAQETPAAAPKATPRATPRPSATPAAPETPGSASVVAAFNALLDGIRKADVEAVSNVYWNSPRLILFNSNGTVTRGWDQMRKNRESSYAEVKDVKLDVRDVSITMLGRDGAIVTCFWTQSQTYKGTPETATGRMTLVFKRVGKDWKAIHVHTSPDKPDPSRVMPSEQATPAPSPVP